MIISVLSLIVSWGISCSGSEDEEEQIVAPLAPSLGSPEVFGTDVILNWADFEDAVAYEMDIANDMAFTDLISGYSALRVEKSELIVEGLTEGKTYYIRVRAVLSDGESAYSNTVEAVVPTAKQCNDPLAYIFKEKDGIVKVEFEDAVFGTGWELKEDNNQATGQGYMTWTGQDHFSKPSTDLVTYSLRISNPGTYKFVWYTAVTAGESGTEHNDTWLRFPDANNYFAKKGEEVIYPKGSGKTPNPEGASADGWFKIYRSGNDLDFKWQARTSDRDPHEIFVTFSQIKTYTMEVSARSNFHGVDKFVMYLESLSLSEATSAGFSEIVCP